MRLKQLRDIYRGQDLYIVGSGPTASLFPLDFLKGKICLSLNDTYKMHPAIAPVALLHHEMYSRTGPEAGAAFHPLFSGIKYPIVKASTKNKLPDEWIDWENPHYYLYDWSHDIERIWEMTKETDYLYYTPEGCSLHAAFQLAWIMGVKNIFVVGCDSRTLGGKHYASYDKSGIRDQEVLRAGQTRNYDSYVYGSLIIQEFLQAKGIRVFNLSSIVGYHMVDYQFDVLSGKVDRQDPLAKVNAGMTRENST